MRRAKIFQDRDIHWGEQWQARIDRTLDAATFFIPILTPLFFGSDACRDELTKFLRREKALRRGDLILPIYYVDTPALNDPLRRARDTLAATLAARQHADWRELRVEPWTDPRLGRMLARMAVQLRDALERQDETGGARLKKRARTGTAARRYPEPAAEAEIPARPAGSKPTRGPSPKIEPPIHVIDPFHRGDFTTISAAIAAAKPGDRILVRPGLYEEGLVIEKPLELLGDGPVEEIVIRASGKDVILFRTTMGRVVNLTLQQTGGVNSYGVNIGQGRLELEGCDISSQSHACVAIHHGADPRLRRNRIHDGKSAGVIVYDGGQGTLEDNEIFANALSGVSIIGASSPMLRRNRIHDGKTVGVHVYDGGQGTLEDNEIFANAFAGVEIKGTGNCMLRRNRIHDGKTAGILVHDGGQGILEDNEIFANASTGVEIRQGGNPLIRRNHITGNANWAVHVHDGGGGTFQENDLRGNARGAWNITKDCESKVTQQKNLTE